MAPDEAAAYQLESKPLACLHPRRGSPAKNPLDAPKNTGTCVVLGVFQAFPQNFKTPVRQKYFADISYPTSVLRPVYCYTVLSSARSGVRGTQRSERPANIIHCTVPY
jgi:hypothetical protein